METQRIEDGLRRLATCTMRESAPMQAWQRGQGVALHGLVQAAHATGDPTYLGFTEEWLGRKLDQGGIGMSINTTAPRDYQAIGYTYSPSTQGLGMLALASTLHPTENGRP